jgi:hypothetical protein
MSLKNRIIGKIKEIFSKDKPSEDLDFDGFYLALRKSRNNASTKNPKVDTKDQIYLFELTLEAGDPYDPWFKSSWEDTRRWM